MENLEFNGHWWIPGDSTEEIPGQLQFSPEDGGELELIGSFDDIHNMEIQNVNTIFGETVNGKRVSLWDCLVQPSGFTIGGVQRQRQSCLVQKILVGDHFEMKQTEFDHFRFSLPHLQFWSKRSALLNKFDEDENPLTQIEHVDPIEAEIGDTTIRLEHIPRFNIDWQGAKTTYSQTAYLHVEFDNPKSLDRILNWYMLNLQRFVSLGVGRPLHPSEMNIYIDQREQPNEEVDIYCQLSNYSETEDEVHEYRMNFSLNDIEFESTLQRWFEAASRTESLHHQYFGTMFNQAMYEQSKFLSLVIGLENYHRSMQTKQTYISQEIHKQVVEQAAKMLPNVASKRRMVNIIQNLGNSLSLKDRLEEIVQKHQKIFSELIDTYEVVRQARDTRHALAHGLNSQSGGKRVQSKPDELLNLNRKLQIITEVCLLDSIGLSEEHIRDKIESRYQYILKRF